MSTASSMGFSKKLMAAFFALTLAFTALCVAAPAAFAAEGDFVVQVKSVAGDELEVITFTADELEDMAVTDTPVYGQYYKNGWNVYVSNKYVPFADLFASISAGSISDECVIYCGTKWSDTYANASSGKWYPNAETTDGGTTFDLGEGTDVPFVLALDATCGSGDTVAEAKAVAESESATRKALPMPMMGIYAENSVGGNRFWTGLTEATVVLPFAVEVQDGNGVVEASVNLSETELKSLAVTDTPTYGQYYKSGWNVYVSSNYVPFEDIFSAAGVEVNDDDVVACGTKWSDTYANASSGKWYPSAEAIEEGTAFDFGEGTDVPFVLALDATCGSGDTVVDAKAVAESEIATRKALPMPMMGIYSANSVGGNRFWTGLDKVVVKKSAIDLSAATVSVKSSYYTYSGEAKTPAPVVELDGQVLPTSAYDVTYGDNVNVGMAQITVEGKGEYTGAAQGEFKITPKGTSITKLTRYKGAMYVKWSKRTTQVSGIQIKYSRNKSMSNAKYKTIATTKYTSSKVKNLKRHAKYYFQVRTYKTVDGVKYVSPWSSKKYAYTK